MPYLAYSKDPDAVEDVTLDWTTHLGGTDTIVTSTWPIAPSGITSSFSSTPTSATVQLTGGTSGNDYRFVNRVVTAGGRTYDWELVVRVYSTTQIRMAPPFAHIVEHTAYTPAIEGEEAFKVEMVAADAADIVQTLVPKPDYVQSVLSSAMDDAQDTMLLVSPYPATFPPSGEVLVESELISYTERPDYTTLAGLLRGRSTTVASAHASGTVVKEIGYALRARRAELAVFEWLWLTRGWRPSRTGVLGSESYLTNDEVVNLVRKAMGPYYGRKGGGIRRAVAMTTFPRRRGTGGAFDWQKGWYDVWP